jgi:SAM-dependent methyltransferase
MNPEEYAIMNQVEEKHWWYTGLRGFLKALFRRFENEVPQAPRILDAGCGTGKNLNFLEQLLKPSLIQGFDASSEALAFARKKNPKLDLFAGDICHPEGFAEDLDLIVSLDVIYIPGGAAALPGLKTLAAHLKRGGFFIINVPAFPWLYSEHDLAVHSQERFTLQSLSHLFNEMGLKIRYASYRVFSLFPAIVLARLPGILGHLPEKEKARSDLDIPPLGLNRFFERLMHLENHGHRRGLVYPWGSSVAVVGQKR